MTVATTAHDLHLAFKDSLGLEWLAGRSGAHAPISAKALDLTAVNPVGYLNIIHPSLVQVIGPHERAFLEGLGKNTLQDTLQTLFTAAALVMVTDGVALPQQALERAEQERVPVFSTAQAGDQVLARVHYYLTREFARHQTLHGVFMEVLGMGVLLAGESGIGKSELALELLSRGHRLIADDAPIFTRREPDVLNGSCPAILCGFLEVRGLGILNIPAMFGDNATKPNKNLRLIINLQLAERFNTSAHDRLYGTVHTRTILEVRVPEVTLPVAPGRNLAVLIEGAVRNHLLRLRGYNAADVFIARQRQVLDNPSS